MSSLFLFGESSVGWQIALDIVALLIRADARHLCPSWQQTVVTGKIPKCPWGYKFEKNYTIGVTDFVLNFLPFKKKTLLLSDFAVIQGSPSLTLTETNYSNGAPLDVDLSDEGSLEPLAETDL